MQSVDPAESTARRVGRYLIYGELASGGMATVHLGRLTGPVGFSKTVAIKRLHPHLASEPDFVAMLIDEAKLVSAISHPNVVSSLDVVYEDGELLLVMDYIEGETLNRLLAPSRKDTMLDPPAQEITARVIIDVLSGLHAAHTAKTLSGEPLNIVHRDVSPQNVIVGLDGIARVLDFGIAKAEHRRHSTRPGRIKGKFAYMSPEQVCGQRVDARTDVFATGVVLWECLAKRRLFRVDGQQQNIDSVLTMPIVPPSHHDAAISPELDAVVLRALARDRDARFESAAQFAEALRAVVEPASPPVVGGWVGRAAKRAIADHGHLLRDLETSTINAPRVVAADHAGRGLPRPNGSQGIGEDLPNVDVPTVVDAPLGRRRSLARSLLFAAVGMLSLLVALVVSWRRDAIVVVNTPEEPRSPASSSGTTAATVKQPEPRESSPTPQAVEALPVLSSRGAAVPATGPSSNKDSLDPGRAAPIVSNPKAGESKSEPRAVAITPKPAPAPAKPAQAAPSCNPPYRIDEFGIRRVRRECL